MVRRERRFLGCWLAALAFAGLLAGHFLGYAAAAPDAHVRGRLLAATGHGSHDVLVSIGVAAALAAAIGAIVHQVRTRGRARGATGSVIRLGAVLWSLQSVGFVALETMERGLSAHAVEHLVHEPAFLLGLAAQLLVAVVAALVVWLLGITVAAILGLLARPDFAPVPVAFRPASIARAPLGITRRAWNLRGPPHLSSFTS